MPKPEVIGITLDKHDWASVDQLNKGVKRNYDFSMELLEEIVTNDEKGRYSFNENKTKIRANQGHSINVDVQLQKAIPPEVLYHGTSDKYVASIVKEGLVAKSRLYVHLSKDIDTSV